MPGLAARSRVYDATRPHVQGAACVNYCDLDFKNYENAYWGGSMAELQPVKKAYDPENLFHYAQSVRA